jgi:hypothetical protein
MKTALGGGSNWWVGEAPKDNAMEWKSIYTHIHLTFFCCLFCDEWYVLLCGIPPQIQVLFWCWDLNGMRLALKEIGDLYGCYFKVED